MPGLWWMAMGTVLAAMSPCWCSASQLSRSRCSVRLHPHNLFPPWPKGRKESAAPALLQPLSLCPRCLDKHMPSSFLKKRLATLNGPKRVGNAQTTCPARWGWIEMWGIAGSYRWSPLKLAIRRHAPMTGLVKKQQLSHVWKYPKARSSFLFPLLRCFINECYKSGGRTMEWSKVCTDSERTQQFAVYFACLFKCQCFSSWCFFFFFFPKTWHFTTTALQWDTGPTCWHWLTRHSNNPALSHTLRVQCVTVKQYLKKYKAKQFPGRSGFCLHAATEIYDGGINPNNTVDGSPS